MSIVRTPIVDDDGTETTGTVINAAWKDEFYDQIDDAIAASPSAPVEQTTTATGAQNNFSLSGNFTYLRCTGAAPVFSGFTINGSAPTAGDRVIIECLGTTAKVTHEDAASTAANRVICPSSIGQIVGLKGRMELVYDGTDDRWREQVIEPGTAVAVAYAGGNFTADGSLTWTVEAADQRTFSYKQRGRDVDIDVEVADTSTGGTASGTLRIAIPFTVATTVRIPATIDDAGTQSIGMCSAIAAQALLGFTKVPSANWSNAAVNTTGVRTQIKIQVA